MSEATWITYIKNRIKNNKNFVGIITGEPGTGKSYTCMSIAEQLDPNFNMTRVAWSGEELITIIQNPQLKSGSVIVFEEVGVGASSAEWYSNVNVAINYLLQTFRHRNFILLLNTPYLDFLAASHRKLVHGVFETVEINRGEGFVKLKAYKLSYNQWKSKFYKKRLRKQVKNKIHAVQFWRVYKPSPQFISEYEKVKKEYTQNLYAEQLQRIQDKKAEREAKKNKTKGPNVVEMYVKLRQRGLVQREIAQIMGVTPRTIERYAAKAKNIEQIQGFSLRKPSFSPESDTDNNTPPVLT